MPIPHLQIQSDLTFSVQVAKHKFSMKKGQLIAAIVLCYESIHVIWTQLVKNKRGEEYWKIIEKSE